MKNKKAKRIIVISTIIALAILLIVAIQNNGILTRKQNQQLANAGEIETYIGNMSYNITDKIENDIVPTLSAGMIPIKLDGEYWTIVDTTDNTWCNYANGVPAYMMLNNGVYQSEEYYQMPDTKELAKAGTQISKDSADLGSIYMWVPRYAYNDEGDIIYIKQTSSVAGTYRMPDVFTYETDKVDYALAGIWVECNILGETELTSKIEEMNTKDSLYGFISNTKTAVMTKDEQTATKILEEYLMQIVGADMAYRPDITNKNYSVIHIIKTNILEPIQCLGHLNGDEEKIEISIKYNKNPIDTVINGNGKDLTLENNKYVQSTEYLASPYIVKDNQGNLKKVEFDNLAIIKSVEDLCKFRDKVNGGNNFASGKVIQMSDIDLSSVCGENIGSWEPIGTNGKSFEGTYDGEYHTISNLYINSDKYLESGLFALTTKDAVIKNIILKDIYIYNECTDATDSSVTGGIVARNIGIIENCGIDSGSAITTKSSNYNIYTGGIAGINTGIIDKCYNKALVSTDKNQQTVTGGIAGAMSENAKISNSYNRGDIVVTGGYNIAGGICGEIYGNNEIINCYNTTTIYNASATQGLSGRIWQASLTVTNSYNLTSTTYRNTS